MVVFALFWVAFFIFGIYKNHILLSEVNKVLPKINEKFGIEVSFSDISMSLTSGTDIENVTVKADGRSFLECGKIRISHSIKIRPKPHVRLESITLFRPIISVKIDDAGRSNLPLAFMTKFGGKFGDGGAGKKDGEPDQNPFDSIIGNAKRLVEIPSSIELFFRGGVLEISDGKFAANNGIIALNLCECKGRMFVDLASFSSTIDVSGRFGADGGRLSLHAAAGKEMLELSITGKKMGLQALAPYLPSFITADPESYFNGTLDVVYPLNAPIKMIKLDGDVRSLVFDNHRLASKPIHGVDVQARGMVYWDKEKKIFHSDYFQVGNNGAYFNLQGQYEHSDQPKIYLRIFREGLPIQKALDAFPADFIPKLKGAVVEGTVDVGIEFELDMKNPKAMVFNPEIKVNDFKMLQHPPQADFSKLHGPFTHEAMKNGEVAKVIRIDASNPDFVSYENIGYWGIRGVLTCEDGRFFYHNGFQLKHIRQSLTRDIVEKRFARGASTISMQTVKNLFLSGEKTLSRKFQEMLLTYYMEQELDKKRIIEIYMNIIEWGPKLYGIGPAARHYFSKSPASLTPLEAAFLGSIISNPVKFHYMYSRGSVTGGWSTNLAFILSKMGVGQEYYEAADPYMPEFGWVRAKRIAKEKLEKEQEEKEKDIIGAQKDPADDPDQKNGKIELPFPDPDKEPDLKD